MADKVMSEGHRGNPKTSAPSLEAKETSGRNGFSNLLRVIAAFGVVCGHVATRAIYNDPNPANPQWVFAACFGIFCLWTLPCFIMISGDMYAARGETRFRFDRWWRRMRRILSLTIAAGIAFILISWLVVQDIQEIGIVSAALGGRPFQHLWYMYFVVGLYALAPLVMRIPSLVSQRVFWAGIFVLFALSFYGGLPGQPIAWKIPFALCLVSYFLIGAQLRNWPKPGRAETWFWIFAFFVAGFASTYAGYLVMQGGYGILAAFALGGSLGGPFAAVMAVAVFRLVRLLPVPGWSARLAPATFLIYIIHPLWILIFDHFGLPVYWHGNLVGIPVVCVGVLFASTVSALTMRWIKQKALGFLPA